MLHDLSAAGGMSFGEVAPLSLGNVCRPRQRQKAETPAEAAEQGLRGSGLRRLLGPL
jgi:hypothetical protein